jgi:DNA polymerase-3 subunit alpha
LNFTVTKDGIIRFGMAAIKGVGGAAVEQIIEERQKRGLYKSVFDFAKRVNLRSVNKRSFEALAMAGAFDCFEGTHRAQYFYKENENDPAFIELIIRHGANYQEKQNSQQVSLFGGTDDSFEVKDPKMPVCDPWPMAVQLHNEKDVTGFYISGHPLDNHKLAMDRFCTTEANELKNNPEQFKGKQLTIAGMVIDSTQKTSKSGSAFGIFTVEDYSGNVSLRLFNEDYLKKKHLLEVGNSIFIQVKVEEAYNQPNVLNTRIVDVILLAEVLDKMSRKITLFVSPDDVDDSLIAEIKAKADENKGNCPLYLCIEDRLNSQALTLKSSFRITPSTFLGAIRDHDFISFKIS